MQPDFTKPPPTDDPATYNRHFIRFVAALAKTAFGVEAKMIDRGVYCSPGLWDWTDTPENLLDRGDWVVCFVINYDKDTTTAWFEAPEDRGRERFAMDLNNDTWSDFVGWVSIVEEYIRDRKKAQKAWKGPGHGRWERARS